MKLGLITNGVSYDLESSLQVMQHYGLDQVELQFIGSKPAGEIGNQSEKEIGEIKELIDRYGMQVSSLSRHLFQSMGVMDVEREDPFFKEQMHFLERLVHYAKILDCPIIRTMSFAKTMIIHGSKGADEWNAGYNKSWAKLLHLLEVPVRYAEEKAVTLAVETGNNAMITSCYLGKKLIEDLGSQHLKLMWDPANTLFCAEQPFPEAYGEIRGLLGHIHIKDLRLSIPQARVECCALGRGNMAPYLEPLAAALKADNYRGGISLESIYRPDGGTYLDGFKASIPTFKEIFSS